MADPVNISLIAAMDRNRGIGKNGMLPWPTIHEDLLNYRQLTTGKPVIMGHNTLKSMPGEALRNRYPIVLTSRFRAGPGVVPCVNGPEAEITLANSFMQAVTHALRTMHGNEIMVAGGGQVYAEALKAATRMYLTRIDAEFDCDTFFPWWDANEWELTQTVEFTTTARQLGQPTQHHLKCCFEVWDRREDA